MAKRLRIIRNAEAGQLSGHILNDPDMMAALQTAINEFWTTYRHELDDAGRPEWDPSPLLVPPTTDLIIALIEQKVKILKSVPRLSKSGEELSLLSQKASLYPVADDILQHCLAEYTPIASCPSFMLIDESAKCQKPWWKFW